MTISKVPTTLVGFLQLCVLPLFLSGWQNLSWHVTLIALLITALMISAAANQLWPLPALGIGVIASVVVAWHNWLLLPLLIAQLLLALVLGTQRLSLRVMLTLWTVQVVFVQVAFLLAVTHVLPLTTIEDLLLISVPFMISLWADQLPAWVDLGLIVLLAIVGFWLQRLTIISAIAMLLLPTALNVKRVQPRLLWYQLAPLAAACVMIITRLHG